MLSSHGRSLISSLSSWIKWKISVKEKMLTDCCSWMKGLVKKLWSSLTLKLHFSDSLIQLMLYYPDPNLMWVLLVPWWQMGFGAEAVNDVFQSNSAKLLKACMQANALPNVLYFSVFTFWMCSVSVQHCWCPRQEMGVGSWAVFGSSGSCVLGFSPDTILAMPFVLWGAWWHSSSCSLKLFRNVYLHEINLVSRLCWETFRISSLYQQ